MITKWQSTSETCSHTLQLKTSKQFSNIVHKHQSNIDWLKYSKQGKHFSLRFSSWMYLWFIWWEHSARAQQIYKGHCKENSVANHSCFVNKLCLLLLRLLCILHTARTGHRSGRMFVTRRPWNTSCSSFQIQTQTKASEDHEPDYGEF